MIIDYLNSIRSHQLTNKRVNKNALSIQIEFKFLGYIFKKNSKSEKEREREKVKYVQMIGIE